MTSLPKICCTVAFIIATVLRATAEVIPVWSVDVAIPGEQVMLYLVDAEVGKDIFSVCEQPHVQFAELHILQFEAEKNLLTPNQTIPQTIPVSVRPHKSGMLQIPDMTVKYRSGRKQIVRIPPLQVCSTMQIKWYRTPVDYGVLWFTHPQDRYAHQPVKASLKLFVPEECFVNNSPQIHSADVKVSAMRPVVQGVFATMHGQLMKNPTAFARGQIWRTADFSGKFIPLHDGRLDINGEFDLGRQQQSETMNLKSLPLPSLFLSILPDSPNALVKSSDTPTQTHTPNDTSSSPTAEIKRQSNLAIRSAVKALKNGDEKEFQRKIELAGKLWPQNPMLNSPPPPTEVFDSIKKEFSVLYDKGEYRKIVEKRSKFKVLCADSEFSKKYEDVLTSVMKIDAIIAELQKICKQDVGSLGACIAYEKLLEIRNTGPGYISDPEVQQALEYFGTIARDFVCLIRDADESEKRQEYGLALSCYMRAQILYPKSCISAKGIQRLSNVIAKSTFD